ncbi:hypothetical protein [Actinomadura fibrosa]|uniref:Saponin hydrolase n=1 Tax=Actinomadura fibrosa TaxID=111802 RepID=A0ABW2XT03_9ACTN|nr:hypothetical protein [Actinomadura fibrosa]
MIQRLAGRNGHWPRRCAAATLATVLGAGTAWWSPASLAAITPDAQVAAPGFPPGRIWPPAPRPEPVKVGELPLPPVAPSTAAGSCTRSVNPRGTGCIGVSTGLQSGGFLPDGDHVTATVAFTGAPAAPDPASVYTGQQLIIVKTDGGAFPGGDPWKCVTCGVPDANAAGRSAALDYPQPFADGKRVLAGTNVIDCSPYRLTDRACTPGRVHIHPIRWNTAADGSGPGGDIRELRLHPDNEHLGFNSFTYANGKLGQFGYLGRLRFDPAPKTGSPRVPRYDLEKVTRLFDPDPRAQPISADPRRPGELRVNAKAISVGELRGFTKDGREVIYIGHPAESSNIDVFAADLQTGRVRRLTSNPEYTDPVDSSPDDRWTVVMDTRGTDRQMFLAGMRDVPPITDLITSSAVSSTRNNGARRFFQPYLIDRYGDRGSYQGQRLNAAGNGGPGAVNDPNWNGMADPRWSPDGTAVAYWQALAVPPACGGANPLPCETSTEPGGRTARMMIARLTGRVPLRPRRVAPISDTVPWGTPYVPGTPVPDRPYPRQGTYTLRGKAFGSAKVTITENPARTAISTIAVRYTRYSDDAVHVLNGTESVTSTNAGPTLNKLDWYSDLVQTGTGRATKKTSPDGFHLTIDVLTNIFQATRALTTTVNGHVYEQPANGT